MKRLSILFSTIMLLVSCQGNLGLQSGFSAKDKAIIYSDSQLLHVYTIADSSELAVLRAPSTNLSINAIASKEYSVLAKRMIETVSDTTVGGVGIAGPQVGINKKIVAVQRFDKEGEPFEVYPNIEIIEYIGEKAPGYEGCLSVPDRREEVERYQTVVISYTDPLKYKTVTETINGFTAVIFQHETDHLRGTLYIDLLK